VRVLVRDPEKASASLPAGKCEIVEGDVTDSSSVLDAMRGVDVVYHAAGLPEQWLADPALFERVNYGGTRNLIDAALATGVRRFVYTSTIDVFAARTGEEFDETRLDSFPKGTAYERSKQAADREVVRAEERGLPAVYLHPAAVYGPGPARSPGINDFVAKLMNKQLPAVPPGGSGVVFSDDVGEAHVRAEERAEVGARFILCERFVTMKELAQIASSELGVRTPLSVPLPIARVVSAASEMFAKVTRRPPLVPAGQLHFLQWGARPKSLRARRVLELEFTPLPEGIARLIEWLRAS
jgi:dihydroflavonol-4-reductase